jgi:hypothetical protein
MIPVMPSTGNPNTTSTIVDRVDQNIGGCGFTVHWASFLPRVRIRGRLTILVGSTNVQTGQTELQKNESVGSIMKTPDNPENIAEEK